MTRYRRTKITKATHESLTIRPAQDARAGAFCADCDTTSTWLSLRDAAAVRDVSVNELIELIAGRRLHYRELADGRGSVCLRSVLADRTTTSTK